jgi:hypothetical protein
MKKRNIILLLILTIIILYFTLKDNYLQIISALLNINIFWLIISYLLVLSYTFLKSLVTNNIINKFKKFEFKKTFLIQIITFFFNSVTPFSSGGQPFQIYMFNKSGNNLVNSTNTVIEETIIHQISLLFVGIITIILNKIFNICNLTGFLYSFLIIGFLINLIIIILLFILSNTKKIDKILIKIISIFNKNNDELKDKICTSLDQFNKNSKILLSNKKRFIKLIFINSVALVCLYLVPLTLLFSLGNYDGFDAITSIVIISFTSIISSYVPLPGGTVGQEYVFSLLFSNYVSNPLLSTLMILWRFVTYYLPLIIGAIILNIKQDLINKKF